MAFLRASPGPESYASRGLRVGLRPLQMADYDSWADLRRVSVEHLMPWEPVWPSDELTRAAYRRRIKHYAREQAADLGYALGIFRLETHQLVGGLSLSNVRRGVTQTATLGYWLGQPHLHQGYMADAVGQIIAFAFDGLRLHRLEAATLPSNDPSIRVLERNGFQREGYARRYLKINGSWSDHVLFGLVAEDWLGPGSALAGRVAEAVDS
jgi:[ribosomal protein S5]-alanine N-acetyltransferase